MKSKTKVLALLPILSLFLTACSLQELPLIGPYLPGGKPDADAPVDLTMWGMWEPQAVFAPVIEQYKQQNPNVTINYENRNLQDNIVEYKERVFGRAADGVADVMVVHNSWIPTMAERGLVAPMPSDMMDANTYNQTFYPVASQTGIVNDAIYAVPAYYDGLALVYNKTHFAEVGQSSPPTAWEEFRTLSLRLTNSSESRWGAAMGSSSNVGHFSDILGLMWAQANVVIPDEIDSTAAQDALTFYTNFVKEDQVWNSTLPEATTAFIDGQVSMIFVPSWQIMSILDSVEDSTTVGVAPVPQAIPSRPATWGSFWVYTVPSGAPNPAASWKLINYLAQEDQARALYDESSKVRLFGSPYARVSMATELSSNDYISPILDTAPYAKSAEITSMSGNRRQVEALEDAVSAVLSGKTSEEALKEAKPLIAQ